MDMGVSLPGRSANFAMKGRPMVFFFVRKQRVLGRKDLAVVGGVGQNTVKHAAARSLWAAFSRI